LPAPTIERTGGVPLHGRIVLRMVPNSCKGHIERTGNHRRLEHYYRVFLEASKALRSCPAGLGAEVGLRWCGARRPAASLSLFKRAGLSVDFLDASNGVSCRRRPRRIASERARLFLSLSHACGLKRESVRRVRLLTKDRALRGRADLNIKVDIRAVSSFRGKCRRR
jgi:hypothetical protein